MTYHNTIDANDIKKIAPELCELFFDEDGKKSVAPGTVIGELTQLIRLCTKKSEWGLFGNPLFIKGISYFQSLGGQYLFIPDKEYAETAWYQFRSALSIYLRFLEKSLPKLHDRQKHSGGLASCIIVPTSVSVHVPTSEEGYPISEGVFDCLNADTSKRLHSSCLVIAKILFDDAFELELDYNDSNPSGPKHYFDFPDIDPAWLPDNQTETESTSKPQKPRTKLTWETFLNRGAGKRFFFENEFLVDRLGGKVRAKFDTRSKKRKAPITDNVKAILLDLLDAYDSGYDKFVMPCNNHNWAASLKDGMANFARRELWTYEESCVARKVPVDATEKSKHLRMKQIIPDGFPLKD